jgi:ribosomal protein S27AE
MGDDEIKAPVRVHCPRCGAESGQATEPAQQLTCGGCGLVFEPDAACGLARP